MDDLEQKKIFETWLNNHKSLIFKIVRAYATTGPDSDDLFQEIIIQVWRSVDAFRNESSPGTWIYRIALNTAIKWVRKETRRHQETSLEVAEGILHEAQVDGRLAWLYDQINVLSPIDRSLTLLFLDGFSYKEMSSMLGISESNVGVKINRIKKQLINQSKKYEHHGI